MSGGQIGIMLAEHQQGREYVKKMKEVFSKYNEDDHAAATKLAKNARAYIALLSQHFDKRNMSYFLLGI